MSFPGDNGSENNHRINLIALSGKLVKRSNKTNFKKPRKKVKKKFLFEL